MHRVVVGIVLLLLPASAHASIIFDGGAPIGVAAGGLGPLADDFVLASPVPLTGVEFWAIESDVTPWNGVLLYYFLADIGGSPALTPFLQGFGQNITRTPTGNTGVANAVLPEYFWTFDFESPISLPTNERLWLALDIEVGIPTGPGVQGHFWEAGSPGFGFPVRRGTYASPTSFFVWEELTPARDAAFRLIGQAIPEASSIVCWLGILLTAAGLPGRGYFTT